MNRKDKKDLIVKRYDEGKTWDQMVHEAHVSPKTVKKILAEYEESQAFELFDRGYSPIRVKTELRILPENVEKHYVAYKKIINLIDLSNVVISLGTQLPDFLDFYNSAKLNGITPFNMRLSLNLAMNIESLNQASINMHTQLHAVTNTLGQERANLKEIQRQIAGLVEYRQRTKNEIKLLNRVIKNSNEYRIFEKLIRDSVNSLTSENYFLLEVAIIAIMTMIQKDPTTIPLLQFPFPDKLDMDVHTTFNQLILYNLIQKAAVFMPKVLDELMKLIGTRVLRNPQDLDAYLHFQSGLSSQCYGEASPQIQSESELNAKSRQPSEIPESIVRDDIFRDKFELENNGIISASDRDQILDDDFFFYCLLSC